MARRTQRELDEQNETASDGRAAAYLKQKKVAEEILDTEQKINKEREEADALFEELLKKEKRLNELKEEGRELSEEAKDLQKERDKIEKEWEDRYESLNEKQERFNELTTETVDLESKLIEYGKKQQKQISDIGDQRSKAYFLAEQAQSKLTGASKTWQDSQGITRDLMFEQSAIAVKTQQILENQGSLSEKYIDSLEDGLSMADGLANIQKDITSSVEKASTGEYQKLDLSKQREDVENRTAELAYIRKQMDEGSIDMSEDEYQILLQQLKSHGEYLTSLEKQNEALAKASEQAKKVLGVFDSILELDIKGALRQGFNLDQIQSGIKKQIGATFANIAAEMKGEKGLVGGLKAAGAGMRGLLDMAPMFMKALGIGALLAIVGFVVDSFGKIDEEVSQLGKDMGISKHEAMELHHAAVDTAAEMKLVGINSKEVAEGLKVATEVMGGMDLASKFAAGDEKVKQLVKDSTVLSKEFGLGADEIKNIQNLATMSGKSMGQLTAEATTLNKGLMNGKESLKMLAAIPPKVAVAFKGGTQELIKAAAKAKMLGMNLEEVQDIGMKMLNIEDSLGKEMEARVLIGRDINLDAARAYALQGDVASLQDELLRQAGSLKEFQSMGPIQQQALADAMGMSVEKMTEMLTNAEKLKKLGIDDAKMKDLQAMNAAELNKELAKGGSQAYKDYVRNLAKEKESEETKKKLADAMTKIQEKLAKMITPLIEIADKFFEILDSVGGLEPILITVGSLLGIIATVWVGKKLFDGFKMVKDTVGSLKDGISGFFDMIKGPGADAMEGLTEQASDLASQVTDAAEGVGEDVASNLTDKAQETATDKATDLVTDKSTELITGNVDELASTDAGSSKKGGGISEFFEKMDPVKMIAGAAALVLVAGALWIAAKAMQEFSTGVSWEGVLMGIATLAAMVAAVYVIGTTMTVAAPLILAGAAALILIGAAMLVAAVAMQQFAIAANMMIPFFQEMTKLDMGQLALLAVNIALLGGAFALLGVMIIPIMYGAAAFTILSASLAVFGVAATIAGEGIKTITSSIAQLLSFDSSKFDALAKGLDTIGSAVMRMGAGSLMSGIGAGISALFGAKSPLEQVMDITTKLDPSKLDGVANAVKSLADAFSYFAEQIGKMKDFDTDKIDEIIEKMEEVKAAQTGGGGVFSGLFTTQSQTAQPVGIGLSPQAMGNQQGNSMSNVEKKLDTLISVISQVANQPTIIKFGEKTVEEIRTQLSFKKAYTDDAKTGNTYGRTIS